MLRYRRVRLGRDAGVGRGGGRAFAVNGTERAAFPSRAAGGYSSVVNFDTSLSAGDRTCVRVASPHDRLRLRPTRRTSRFARGPSAHARTPGAGGASSPTFRALARRCASSSTTDSRPGSATGLDAHARPCGSRRSHQSRKRAFKSDRLDQASTVEIERAVLSRSTKARCFQNASRGPTKLSVSKPRSQEKSPP